LGLEAPGLEGQEFPRGYPTTEGLKATGFAYPPNVRRNCSSPPDKIRCIKFKNGKGKRCVSRMQIKHVKILSASTTIMEVFTYVLLAISIFTVVSSFMGSLSPEEGKEPLKVEISPLGDAVFSLKVKNSGLLDCTMKLNVKIMSKDEVVAEGEESLTLPPKGEDELRLRLELTREQIEELETAHSRTFFSFESRTLYGLAGMGVRAEMGGG